MSDDFLLGLACLALYTLTTIVAEQSSRRGWLAGYALFAALAGWLLVGIPVAIAVVLAGSALGGRFWLSEHRSRARSIRAARGLLIWGSALVAAALGSVLTGMSVPLVAPSTAVVFALGLTLLIGWGASLVVDWFFYRSLPGGREVSIELAFLVLTGAIPFAVSAGGMVVFYAAVIVLGVHAYHQWQTAALRRHIERQQRETAFLRQIDHPAADVDLDSLYWQIYQHLDRLLEVSLCCIVRYNDACNSLAFPLVVASGKKVNWPEQAPDDDPIAQVIHQKRPVCLAASDGISLQPHSPTTNTLYRHFLGVPLLADSQVIGAITILNEDSETAYQPRDIETLQAIASQVALTIHHARLHQEQTDMMDKLAQINDSVHQILFNSNRDNALESACRLASRICGTEHVALFLIDDAAGTLHLYTSTGLNEAYQVWAQDHPPVMRDTPFFSTDLPDSSPLRQMGDFRAMVEFPICSDRMEQGLLVVYFVTPNYLHPRTLDMMETLVNHVSAMLRNVQLFGVMETYAYEMSELVQLSRISTSSLDIDGVVHDIADMLRQITAMSRVAIISLEDQRTRLLATVSSQNGASSGGNEIFLDPFPELTQLNQSPLPERRAYQQADDQLSPAMREYMIAHQEQTVALVPLVVNMDVLGAVWLGSQEKRVFEEREWQFIEMATNQIAAQIRNIRLYEQTQQELNRRLKQASVIEEIARQVSSSLDFNVIIDHVLEAALNATGADLASLGLVNDSDYFRVIEYRIHAGQSHKRHSTQPLEDGVMGEVLRTKETIIVSDNQADPHYVSEYPSTYRSSLAVPLLENETVIGVLNVEANNPGVFNTEHALFLVNLAGHAVISIDNARFVKERQNEIDRLKNLRDLSLWLVSADDTRSVGYEILETALQLLNGQNSVLYEYDPQTEQLKTLARSWYNAHSNVTADEILPYAVAHQAVANKKVVVIENVEEHPTWTETAPFNYRSVLAFPLRQSEQIQFVILITKEEPYTLADQDMSTIDLLASQAIGHLENARLHERIREGRDQMRAILNATQDGLILLDRSGHVVEVNPSACDLIGVDFGEHIGYPFASVVQNVTRGALYTRQAIDDLMTTLRNHPEAESRRAFTVHTGQHTRHLEETGRPVHDETGRIVGRLLVLRDVTELRLLEEQREDLADMVVHDLRGPLGAIINALNLALPVLGSPADQADTEQLLHGSIISARRLLNLVNTLLDISKMQHSGLELTCQPVALATIVETAAVSLTSLAEQSGISIRIDLSPDLPRINVDRDTIERVVINLLDNALRYTPDGGQIRIAASVQGSQWLEVRVADSGPGIPPDRRQQVFQRFERIPGQNPQRGHRGHGLGLTFTRLAVEAHGGTIHLGDDDQMSGACFIFTLPIAE